jgi:peptidyl-tRNA hydrolase
LPGKNSFAGRGVDLFHPDEFYNRTGISLIRELAEFFNIKACKTVIYWFDLIANHAL